MSNPLQSGRTATPAIVFILITAVIDVVAIGIVYRVLPMLIEEMSGSIKQAGS